MELYSQEIVYRPQEEAESVLLEVGVGCSYSGCTFCVEQAKQRYRQFSLEEVRQKIALLAELPENQEKRSAFLLGENALVRGSGELLTIIGWLREALPALEAINLYGRAADVLRLPLPELRELAAAGLACVYIGVESGSDRILKQCKKGTTVKQLLAAVEHLEAAGIAYSFSSIIGLGGRALCGEHARQTADFYNQTRPRSIRLLTLTPEPGTELAAQVERGEFRLLTPGEAVLELRLLVEYLEVEGCLLIANHVTNPAPFAAYWSQQKEAVLDYLDAFITSVDLQNLPPNQFEFM